ncbi:hypothetical protein [Spirochaeta africana]|uniref:Tetratricopeptide repeat protein n=1 Tax=Spirochaeta africana (strain ATCC 700263 / DSM 8902 / Z-7692) TaxID=889378 RepID=H9UGW0_SPIAZ|nr:hypothetical protein [Spirochaeta africana]AFG36753.1 hypothetical protein Spiaf_0653 [Spirochaeta africana DSM 8902]
MTRVGSRLIVLLVSLAVFSGCATQVEIQRPAEQRGWDDSVNAALEDAHQQLQQARDPGLQVQQALQLADAYIAMGAESEASHYAQFANRIIVQHELPLYDQTLDLIRVLYALGQEQTADRRLQEMLDRLTLSGDEPLQGEYLVLLLELVFQLEEPSADLFRRVTDRVLFIGDAQIRSSVLRETIRLMWQASFSGDVTGIVQHAIAATSGIEDRVAQAAGYLHLSGLIHALGRQITGVDAQELAQRGMRIWRQADLWSIERDSAAMAVRGSMLSGNTAVLEEILNGIPGNQARVEILVTQAYWLAAQGLRDPAAVALEYAGRYVGAVDSPELRAAGMAGIALGQQLIGDPDAAAAGLRSAADTAVRYWNTNPEAAYAAARVLAERGEPDAVLGIAGDQRDPLNQAAVYLRLYAEMGETGLSRIDGLILRELPFVLRRIGWSRSNQLPELVAQVVVRAAERGDTALLAELRAIRPPQELQVMIEARYAQALLIRLEQ